MLKSITTLPRDPKRVINAFIVLFRKVRQDDDEAGPKKLEWLQNDPYSWKTLLTRPRLFLRNLNRKTRHSVLHFQMPLKPRYSYKIRLLSSVIFHTISNSLWHCFNFWIPFEVWMFGWSQTGPKRKRWVWAKMVGKTIFSNSVAPKDKFQVN